MNCILCGRQHDGSMMRTHPYFTRVRTMIETEVPTDAEGRLKACHLCQRSAFHAGGFVLLLAKRLERAGRQVATRQKVEERWTRMSKPNF